MSSLFLLVRLAVATGLVLAPGAIAARAVGVRSTSATLAWGLGIVFGAMTVVFAVHGSLTLALVLLLVAALVAAPFAIRRPVGAGASRRASAVWAAGAVLGLLLWHVAGEIGGDGLFHLARVRKLVELGDLHLSTAERVRRRRAPPRLRVPALAGVPRARSRRSPSPTRRRSCCTSRPCWRRSPSSSPTRPATRCSGGSRPPPPRPARPSAIAAMAAGHGGSYTALALPATASRQLLVPAALALALAAMRTPSKALLASAGLASLVLAVVHPTYAIFLWIPFAGFLAVRWAWRREEVRQRRARARGARRAGGLFLAWLVPVVRSTASVSPDAARAGARASSTTRASCAARPTTSRSRRRCSAGRAPSPWRRCC